jgi:hypothetical protein
VGTASGSDATSGESPRHGERQAAPEWIADGRATRPRVERKIAHLMRRRHGGRRARVRGRTKIAADSRSSPPRSTLHASASSASPSGPADAGCLQLRQQDYPSRLDPPPALSGSKRAVTHQEAHPYLARHPEGAAVFLAGLSSNPQGTPDR